MICEVFHRIGCFVHSVTAGEWIVFFAELLVAAVIYLEFEHSSDSAFFAKATNKSSDADRKNIYHAFQELKGTNEERLKSFHENLVKENDKYAAELRNACHDQLAMFNEMGFELQRWFSAERIRSGKNRLVSIFPHGPIFFWFIVGPYVRERRRMTGPWFGQYALIFIKKSLDFALKFSNELTLNLPGAQDPVVLNRAELESMRTNLQILIQGYKPLKRWYSFR